MATRPHVFRPALPVCRPWIHALDEVASHAVGRYRSEFTRPVSIRSYHTDPKSVPSTVDMRLQSHYYATPVA